MISLATALALLATPVQTPQAGDVTALFPSHDAWVYPHAGDAKDQYLRAWGRDGVAVPSSDEEEAAYSYSYLRWDLPALPSGQKLTRAELVLTHVPDPDFTVAGAAAAPLQARPLSGPFDEETWNYEKVSSVAPGKGTEAVFGTGAPARIPGGTNFEISIDLMRGPNKFAVYFEKAAASEGRVLLIAVTSALDPAEFGRNGIYKFFSKDAPKAELRPVLRLWFQKS